MNRSLSAAAMALALAAATTVITDAQSQGRGRSAEKPGKVTRVHHDKKAKSRPGWAESAVGRGRNHLAEVAAEAGVETPDAELALDTVIEDDLGQIHLRFDQEFQGIPVFGSQVIVELDEASGNKIFGKADPSARIVNTNPRIAREAAVQTATAALGYAGAFATPPTAELVILPVDERRDRATLTWLVELSIGGGTDAASQHRYFVSADDGTIVMHYDAVNHATGTSYYSGTVSIGTTYAKLNDGKFMYRLWDQGRGGFYTIDLLNGGVLSNTTNVWGNTYPYRETAGVDAHFGVTKAWDYFSQKMGWAGINGAGEGVINQVHLGRANAEQWNGVLTFGDGDGTTSRPWVSVDVVAHEYMHAVIWRTANLVYTYQSGALNEAFADIFGTAVEHFTGIRPDYLIGEDFMVQKPLRSLANPPQYGQPDHMDRFVPTTNDNGGVHINSGIPNKAFYLLAEGGRHPISGVTVARVSRPVAEWIYFRALRKLPSNATFSQARAAVLSSAADGYGLYSQAWYAAKASWDAVGVY